MCFIAVEIAVLGWMLLSPARDPQAVAVKPAAVVRDPNVPNLQTDILFANRNKIWDIGFLPTGEMLFIEQRGDVQLVRAGQVAPLAALSVAASEHGGLLGLAIDPDFAVNRFIYTCYNSTSGDIRVSRWVLPPDFRTLTSKLDIITGIPSDASGSHSGCRVAFGPDGFLWVGTGDALIAAAPQDPRSLGGKILRVDRQGVGAFGNLGKPFDPRIYSYGHRNTQGIAFFKQPLYGMVGVSSEQGPEADDEVNALAQGNFGWAPAAGAYTDDSPMTDTATFPNAIPAIWRTGAFPQSPSDMIVIDGPQWKGWNGAVAMAVVSDEHLKILQLGKTYEENRVTRLLQAGFGKIRSVAQGPDGNLYIGTSNGADDKIIRLTPTH
jgi:aldose sugar dehydrogenase